MHLRYLMSLAALCGSAAGAADNPPKPKALEGIVNCRAIEASAPRLACYDKAAATLVDAADKGTIVIADKSEVQRTRRSLFGFSLPNLPLLGGGKGQKEDDETVVRELATTVVSASPAGYGTWAITVAEGGRWRTSEASRTLTPRTGDKITIKRGPLGGYIANIGGQRGVKIQRVG
ncbi:hypothetical protein H5J25_12935 [Sphingomonas aliaeris]|uniref:Uncharacterized protein n=1 Tax=Sphingomonas aliaeris TaxID=2759526 RepID=A0A974S3B4_9SPHN|nr:hypothetical protein [Sphingomonas aliaeris]QQV76377.1 hypothetical protein H5J25_12935 [Sphingomonas aliaeris]